MTFTGFLSGEPLLTALSTFDVGVIPDPKNIYNDKISMNKVFEYMTLGIPFVAFDLDETKRTAGDACLYAADNAPADLAKQLLRLTDDAALAEATRTEGQRRLASEFSWEREQAELSLLRARACGQACAWFWRIRPPNPAPLQRLAQRPTDLRRGRRASCATGLRGAAAGRGTSRASRRRASG